MDSTIKSSLTSISIGPGIRGIERGVERVVRLEHLAYVEIEAFIIENLVAQMERGVLAPAVIWSDCKTMPCKPFRGITDIIFAGYPCQPFSTAGKRRGIEDPRHLYPYIERAIRIIQPRICFFENVRGHITSGLPEVIASLEGLGYRVHWGIYSAEETGATHKRERVFIMAYSQSAGKRRGKGNIHQADGRQVGELPLITHGTGGDLGDPGRIWRQQEAEKGLGMEGDALQKTEREESSDRFKPSGELENPAGFGCGSLRTESKGFKWSAVFNNASDELADAKHRGSQKGWRHSFKQDVYRGNENNGSATSKLRYVARPGQPQYEWESPRTIITDDTARLLGGYSKKYPQAFQKRQIDQVAFDDFTGKIIPHLDLSAHGYHFREDILRALGNSVYEDTAELAFKDLIRKHRISL